MWTKHLEEVFVDNPGRRREDRRRHGLDPVGDAFGGMYLRTRRGGDDTTENRIEATAAAGSDDAVETPISFLDISFSQTLVERSREAFSKLLNALSGVEFANITATRSALWQAIDTLDGIGSSSAEISLRAQIRLVRSLSRRQPATPDPQAWTALEAALQVYLANHPSIGEATVNGPFEKALEAVMGGNPDEAERWFNALLLTVDRHFDAFPISLAREDIAFACKLAQDDDCDWRAVKTAVQSGLAELYWVVHGNAEPLVHAYYMAAKAYDGFPDNVSKARRLMAEVAETLRDDYGALADMAVTLAHRRTLDRSYLSTMTGTIRREIEQAQHRHAMEYLDRFM